MANRVSQDAVEVLHTAYEGPLVVSQVAVEVLRFNNNTPLPDPHTHLSQMAVEVLEQHIGIKNAKVVWLW